MIVLLRAEWLAPARHRQAAHHHEGIPIFNQLAPAALTMALMFRLTLLSLLGLAAGKIESSCFWDSGKGASFDLSRLTDAGNRPDGR